jgi:hypothetical protein
MQHHHTWSSFRCISGLESLLVNKVDCMSVLVEGFIITGHVPSRFVISKHRCKVNGGIRVNTYILGQFISKLTKILVSKSTTTKSNDPSNCDLRMYEAEMCLSLCPEKDVTNLSRNIIYRFRDHFLDRGSTKIRHFI